MQQFKTFQYTLEIKEHHLDTFGHVNNATYLTLLEEARWELLNTHGFGLKVIQEKKMGPIVLACDIKFIKELMLREQITIQSQVLSYQKKIAVMRQTILNQSGVVCSEAKLTFGFFNLKTRKLMLPSDEWLRAIGCYEEGA